MAFVTISRLASKRLLGAQQLIKYNVPAMSAGTATMQPGLPREGESHDDKNARLVRPMSPHVTIYSFGMTGTLSITHRITGLALSSYAIALAGAAFCPEDFNAICAYIEALKPGTISIMTAKFCIAYPLMYHTCNGVRHLLWDTGKQLNKNAVVTTGVAMLAASFASTLYVMFM